MLFGELISLPVNEEKYISYYVIEFNASSLVSIYTSIHYKQEAGNFIETKKCC